MHGPQPSFVVRVITTLGPGLLQHGAEPQRHIEGVRSLGVAVVGLQCPSCRTRVDCVPMKTGLVDLGGMGVVPAVVAGIDRDRRDRGVT